MCHISPTEPTERRGSIEYMLTVASQQANQADSAAPPKLHPSSAVSLSTMPRTPLVVCALNYSHNTKVSPDTRCLLHCLYYPAGRPPTLHDEVLLVSSRLTATNRCKAALHSLVVTEPTLSKSTLPCQADDRQDSQHKKHKRCQMPKLTHVMAP